MRISHAPHFRRGFSKNIILWIVFYSLFPAGFAGVFFFGVRALFIILMGVFSSIFWDNLGRYLASKKSMINPSALITGLLVAYIIPPSVPLWIPFLGTGFAILIGKHVFGEGNSLFNPALVGRAFLVVSWPVLMSRWVLPDGVSGATPLSSVGSRAVVGVVSNFSLFFGNVGGCIGETSAFAILIGALFLIFFGLIDFLIPIIILSVIGGLSIIFGMDPLFQLFSGGLFLGAFFMATDYVTIPITRKGRVIFALGVGILIFLFRVYSSYPEGVMYAILLMNAASPFIERFSLPRVFGK